MKWLLLILSVVTLAVASYCFVLSSTARKVVSAVNGPPLIQAEVDFSKPFTNEFVFRHIVQPMYGTMYLMLRAEPSPKNWATAEDASEALQKAGGQMRVTSMNGTLLESGPLNWFCGWRPHVDTGNAPLQAFYGRLPLGDYRLAITTAAGTPELQNCKQTLLLRYDMIHERTIASALRGFAIVFAVMSFAFGAALACKIKAAQ